MERYFIASYIIYCNNSSVPIFGDSTLMVKNGFPNRQVMQDKIINLLKSGTTVQQFTILNIIEVQENDFLDYIKK